jgi:hypothetical protein
VSARANRQLLFFFTYATEICRWICVVVLYPREPCNVPSFTYLHIYSARVSIYLSYLFVAVFLHADEICLCSCAQKTKHELSHSFRSPLFPVVSVLFFVLNRLAGLLTGRETNQTHTRRVVCDFAFSVLCESRRPSVSLLLVVHCCTTASNSQYICQQVSCFVVFLSLSLSLLRSPSPLSLSLCYIYIFLYTPDERVSRCCNPAAAPRSK